MLPEYQTLVGDVAAEVDDTRRLAEQTSLSRAQIAAMQAAESGVNLDEELAQMVSIQHIYAASARLLAAYDQMLGTLIERS
jgi:flagellar hook-associated protein 1 FlgK